MNRGPRPGTATGDVLARARAAWGDAMPAWVTALAEAAQRETQAGIARRLDYSASTISQVLSRTYRGDLGRVEQVVAGALMGATVDCPILGDIGRDRCLTEQREPFRATSALRAHLFHACQRCPHRMQTAATTDGAPT